MQDSSRRLLRQYGHIPKDSILILWHVSFLCNFSCNYCSNRSSEKTHFQPDLKLLNTIVDNIVGLNKSDYRFRLFGGEPTLFKHLEALCSMLFDRLGDRITRFEIVTNGSRPSVVERLLRKFPKLYLITSIHLVAQEQKRFHAPLFELANEHRTRFHLHVCFDDTTLPQAIEFDKICAERGYRHTVIHVRPNNGFSPVLPPELDHCCSFIPHDNCEKLTWDWSDGTQTHFDVLRDRSNHVWQNPSLFQFKNMYCVRCFPIVYPEGMFKYAAACHIPGTLQVDFARPGAHKNVCFPIVRCTNQFCYPDGWRVPKFANFEEAVQHQMDM